MLWLTVQLVTTMTSNANKKSTITHQLQHSKFSKELLQIAYGFRRCTDLNLRRATAAAMHTGMKHWIRDSSGVKSMLSTGATVSSKGLRANAVKSGSTVLDSLLNVASASASVGADSEELAEMGAELYLIERLSEPVAEATLQFTMDTIASETDMHCIVIKQEILRVATDKTC